MWRQFAVVVTLISACAPLSEEDVATRRQPLPALDSSVVEVKLIPGSGAGARLGTSLDACRGLVQGGYLAGAPGINGVYASAIDGVVTIPGQGALANIGSTVMCDRSQSIALLGGNPGLFRVIEDGGHQQLFDAPVLAITGAVNTPPLVTLQNGDGGTDLHRLRFPAGGFASEALGSGTSKSYGAALAYSSSGEILAIGDANAARAEVFRGKSDGGIERLFFATGTNASEFGRVVLLADVTPDTGPELVVAAPAVNRVEVYSATGRLRYALEGKPYMSNGATFPPSEFGAALAVEPSLRGISALWVGEPGTNRVYRCVGTDCVTFSTATRVGRFGASLAFDGPTLVVGDPGYSAQFVNQGAVYEFSYDGGAFDGEAQPCMAAQPCMTSETCRVGTCVGGVFCLSSTPTTCAPSQVCSSGQCVGEVDSGVPDAGTNEEDGGIDAGTIEPDAGVVDEEPDDSNVNYRTGCTSAPGALWLLLATLVWRRRFPTGV